jgi:uncharacterized protein YecE (DUF72 family)
VLEPLGKDVWYYKDVPEEIRDELWAQYRAAIFPLAASDKLGAVHFQFAPQVLYGRRSFDHIEECIAQLPGCRLAIEFRNKSWFDGENAEKTLAFERERKLVNVIVDEPQGVANYIPSVWEVTNPELAVVRLHGRNHETWAKKGLTSSAQRFNYDYSDAEMEELAKPITGLHAPHSLRT